MPPNVLVKLQQNRREWCYYNGCGYASLIHFISPLDLLCFACCFWDCFTSLSHLFAIFYLHNRDMWSSMSLFPLANVLKHELIISKAIHSVSSCYIHIPTPVPVSLSPFLTPFLLIYFPPGFCINADPVALNTFTSKSVKEEKERSFQTTLD